MIQFDCPKCLQQINALDPQAGKPIACPECEAQIEVPTASPSIFEDLFDGDNPIETVLPADDPDLLTLTEADEVDVEQSSDEYEDLQFPETLDSKEVPADPAAEQQPEKVTDARLSKQQPSAAPEPVADPEPPSTFAVKCPVCDSHLFVTTALAGTKATCADCFSEIDIPHPTPKQLETFEQKQAKVEKAAAPSDEADSKFFDEEPVPADSAFGLAPVEHDLLAPKKFTSPTNIDRAGDKHEDDDELKLEPVPDFADGETESELVSQEPISPYRSRSAQIAQQNKRRKKTEASQSPSASAASMASSNHDAKLAYPEFEFETLFNAAFNLVINSKVVVRCVVTALLIAAGNVVCHTTLANYYAIKNPTMGDSAVSGFWRFGVGWTLFGIGTILLWYFAGVIFRKAAEGQQTIDSWKIGPSTEWASTFLLTSFSFAVAGSPMLMTGAICLIAPVQFFLALPMLLSAWFTQSPFQIIAVNAFSRYRQQRLQWRAVWLIVLTLASIAFTSGLLLMIPIPYLNVLTSLAGAMLLSLATLAYAAVAGWHSGKVVEELN